jgi:hypothetical protein
MSEKVQDAHATVRLPKAVRDEIASMAAAERRSVANFIRVLIADGIAARRAAGQSGQSAEVRR